jgi:WD40 repeat protein
LWDAASGRELMCSDLHRGPVRALAFSPDGALLCSGGEDGTIRFSSVNWRCPLGPSEKLGGRTTHLAVSPDGRTVAVGDGGGDLRVWDAGSGALRHELAGHGPDRHGKPSAVTALRFRPDGALLSGGRDDTVRLWDVAAGKERSKVAQPFLSPPLAFTADGTQAFAEGLSGRITSTADGKILRDRLSCTNIRSAGFSADGTRLAVGSWQNFHCYELPSGKELANWIPEPGSGRCLEPSDVCLSPDGRLAAVADFQHTVTLRLAATGAVLREWPIGKAGARSVAFSADARLLACGSCDGIVEVREVSSGGLVATLTGHRGRVESVVFFPDGRRLATGGTDTSVLIWDWSLRLPDEADLFRTETGRARLWGDLAAADAGRAFPAVRSLLAAGDDGTAWLAQTLRPVTPVAPENWARWLADLDDAEFATRQAAEAALRRQGRLAEPRLRRFLQGDPSPEARRRAEGLLAQLPTEPWQRTEDERRWDRALLVLEGMDTPRARQLLRSLATGDEGALLTQEAKAALDRLARRSP